MAKKILKVYTFLKVATFNRKQYEQCGREKDVSIKMSTP